MQCHTNVVAVFNELEEEPSLFGSQTNLASLAAAEQQEGGGGDAGDAAPQPPPAGRTLLLRNPPREFVRPLGRTPKLRGMMQVVFAASESCATLARSGV